MSLENALQAIRQKQPDLAVGLGSSIGENPPEIICGGPLWRGSSSLVASDACWHIGSITKTMTSTLVMQQVDRGKLDLDCGIGKYLTRYTDLPEDWSSIRLAELLSHTAGIAPNPPIWQFLRWRDLDPVIGRRKVLERAWNKRPKLSKGQHGYSNLGFMLVGFVLENLLDAPWEDLIRQHIAMPLGLTSLGFGAPSGLSDPKGHRKPFFRLKVMEREDLASDNPSWLGPAGTVHMSIKDLLAYGRAHLMATRGNLPSFLSKEASLRMLTPISDDYGLGWVIQDKTAWHNGSNTMWYALLTIDPISDSVFVAVQNAMTRTNQIDALGRETVQRFRQKNKQQTFAAMV